MFRVSDSTTVDDGDKLKADVTHCVTHLSLRRSPRVLNLCAAICYAHNRNVSNTLFPFGYLETVPL